MKKSLVPIILPVLLVVFLCAGRQIDPQEKGHFYNVDTEIRIEGDVQEVTLEPRYKDRAPFLIVLVRAPGQQDVYSIEVSPSWFFGQDLHKGEKVKIVGSLAGEMDGIKMVIARQMNVRGKTITLRDKKGFPSWSGGAARQRGRRRIGGL